MKRKTSKRGGTRRPSRKNRRRRYNKYYSKKNIKNLNEILKDLKGEIKENNLSIDLSDENVDMLNLNESTIDEISKKIEEGIKNINDYYIECFENNDYLEFMNQEKLIPFISKLLEKEPESVRMKIMKYSVIRKKLLNRSRFLPNDLFTDINILKIIYLFKYHYSKAVFMRLDILELMFLTMKKMVLNIKIDLYDPQKDFDRKFNGIPLWIAKNRDDEFGWTQEIFVIAVESIDKMLYYINIFSEWTGWSNESKYHKKLQSNIKGNLQDVRDPIKPKMDGGGNYPIENIFFDYNYREYYYNLISLQEAIKKLKKNEENQTDLVSLDEMQALEREVIELKQKPLKTRENFKERDYTEPEEWKNPRNFADYIGEEKKEFDVMSILHKYYHINENYGLHEEEIQYVIASGYITYFFKIIFLNNLMVANNGSYFLWEMIKQIMYVYFDIEWNNDPDYLNKELQILRENQINGFSQGDNRIKFLIDNFMDELLEETFIINEKEEVLKNREIQGSVQYIDPNQDSESEIKNAKESLEKYFPGDKQSQYKLLETTEEKIKEEIYNNISSIIDENDEAVKRKTVDEIYNNIIKLKPKIEISKIDDRNKIVRNTINKDILNDIIDEDRSKRYTYMELKKILIAIFKIYELRLSQNYEQRKVSFIMLRDLQNIINELSIQISKIHFVKHITEISNFEDDDKHIIIDSAFYLEYICNFSKIIRKATYENHIVKKEKIEKVINLMVILATQFVKGLHATTFNLRNVLIGFGFFGLWIIISVYTFLPIILVIMTGSLIWYGSAQLLKSTEANNEVWSPYMKGATTGVGVGVTTALGAPIYSSISTGLNTHGWGYLTHGVYALFGLIGTSSWIGTLPLIGGPITLFIQWGGFDIIRIYYALFIPMLFTWGIWLNNKSVIMDFIKEMKGNNSTKYATPGPKKKKNEGGSKRRSKKRSKRRSRRIF
jgi:hypothetical protein